MKSGARLRDVQTSRAWFLPVAVYFLATAVNARSFVGASAPDKIISILPLLSSVVSDIK